MEIPHPSDSNRTLWDARNDVGPFTGPVNGDVLEQYQVAQQKRQAAYETGVVPLGSGSDFTVFLQRLGVSTLVA
jgi:N-acetylated-alpha-linked acidic dipeptidase